MKKLVFFSILLLSYIAGPGANAQTFTVAYDTATGYTSSTVDVHNTITNTSASALTINWRVTDSTVNNNWHIVGLCDNSICWPTPVPDVREAAPFTDTMGTKVQFDGTNAPNNTFCSVTIKYWEKNNPFNTRTISYYAYKNMTGVTTVNRSDDDVVLYPNPARDVVNVVFDGNAGIKSVAIYNMIGKVVSAYKVVGNSAKIEIDGIPSGVYFIRLLDAQKRIVATRKFTHQ